MRYLKKHSKLKCARKLISLKQFLLQLKKIKMLSMQEKLKL